MKTKNAYHPKRRKEYVDYEAKFADRLAQLRLLSRVSCREMSLALGQCEGYVNKIENGKTFPSLQNFFYICDYLDVTPKEFFSFIDDGAESPEALRFFRLYAGLPEERRRLLMLLAEVMQ